MIKIIKKNNKYFRQEIEETEITLEELQEESKRLKDSKKERIEEETKMFDDQIAEVQNQINQIKVL